MTAPDETAKATKDGRASRSAPSISIAHILERGGLPLLLLGLIVLFSVLGSTGSTFTSGANVKVILGSYSVTGVIALAMVIPLVGGYFDVSVAAVSGMASIAMASAIGDHGASVLVGILVALGVGLIAGIINGALVAGLRLNGLVVTLGTYTLIGGLIQLYTKGTSISSGLPASLSQWSAKEWLGVPRPFIVLILVAIVVWYGLMHTPYGRKLEGVGSNPVAARLVGIRVNWLVFCSYMASATLAGVAGVILTSTSGVGNPTAGASYLFPSLAAVFIGSTAIRPGRYNVWGTMFGVFVVAVAVDGFTLLGAQAWVSEVFNGGALVIAVAVSTLMGRRREARARAVSVKHFTADADEGKASRGDPVTAAGTQE